MYLSIGQYAQLIASISLGIIIFVSAFLGYHKFMVISIILLLPFQIITSKFGSINMILIYLLGVALIFTRNMTKYPLISCILFILFAYFLSMSQLDPKTSVYLSHVIYIISLGSNFLIFYIVYNFILKENNPKNFLNILILLNFIVIIYALFQMQIGFESYSLFGIEELTVKASKELPIEGGSFVERRLRGGPFASASMNAEFMAIQIFILGYFILFEKKKWKLSLYLALIALNYMILIGTGSRGGFFSFSIGVIMFYLFYFQEIGFKRVFLSLAIFSFLLLFISIITVTYTQYDSMFIRIKKTKIEGVIPDTRKNVWKIATEAIKEKPFLGWGPRLETKKLRIFKEEKRMKSDTTYKSIPYPHNLYLFLLYTLGIVGLISYLLFFSAIYYKFIKANRRNLSRSFNDGLPKLGIILITVFLIDQIKLEFLRHNLHDYQNYIFMIFAAFIAFSDLVVYNFNKRKTV